MGRSCRNAARAAVAQFLTVVLVVCVAAAAVNTAWAQNLDFHLKFLKVQVFPGDRPLNEFGSVTAESYDENGGSVDINVRGDVAGLCPGGAETMRFKWRFGQNVSRVVPASGVSASLEAGVVSQSAPCTTGLAARSEFTLAGSEGSATPFSAAENQAIDGTLLYQLGNERGRIFPHTDDGSRTSGVFGVRVRELPDVNAKFAWFELTLSTPGGNRRYVYLFEILRTAPPPAPVTATSLSIEYDTDRPGNDYSNYDLPKADFELCRSACAGDSNCGAYTYVKPGVQGASARCWLKSTVPAAGSSNCCISGVKTRAEISG